MKRSKRLFTILGLSTVLVAGASISASALSSTIAGYASTWYSTGHGLYFVSESSAPKAYSSSASYFKVNSTTTNTFYDNGNGSYQTPIMYGTSGVNSYYGQFMNEHYETTSAQLVK